MPAEMRITLFTFVVGLLPSGSREELAKKDLDKLQGTYIMAALEVDGKLVGEKRLEGTTLTIKGDKYIVKTKNVTTETVLRLDPTKDPKEVDMVFVEGANKDKAGKGIYKIEGDTFKLCRALELDKDRPREFGTWPNSGVFLVTWKRK